MKNFGDVLERIMNRVNSLFVLIAAIMLIGLMVLVNADLLLRFFFRSPILGVTEITEIFLLYITFLGAAWVYRDDGHVVVDVLLYNLVAGSKKFFTIQNHVIVGIISFVIMYYGFLTTFDHYTRGVCNPTILETPIALAVGVIPVGAAALLLEILIKLSKLLTQKG